MIISTVSSSSTYPRYILALQHSQRKNCLKIYLGFLEDRADRAPLRWGLL
jgi:hypothetical protein